LTEGKEQLHFTDIFKKFSRLQQGRLSSSENEAHPPSDIFLQQLLSRYQTPGEVAILQQALSDPYFPLAMVTQTLFADVTGMRFYINKRRPDLEPVLAKELLEWTEIFHRIRLDIRAFFDAKTITCIPFDGKRHPLPSGNWCTLCGVCCQIGGVPPDPPPGITYPDHWHAFLAGKTVENQQLCPFLCQYFGEPMFFCGIHNIKPMACRRFDKKDCQQRLADRDLHFNKHS